MENEVLQTIEYSGKQVRIIEAAEMLFAEHGFDGTSVRDIAQAAGVNVAMISYYFGSKENLLKALFNHRITQSYFMLETIVNNKELDPLGKVRSMVDYYVERIMENQCFHKITIREQVGHEAPSPIAGYIKASKLRNLDMVKKIVAEGIRKKVFNKGTDVELLMTTMVGTIYQLVSGKTYYHALSDQGHLSDSEYDTYIKKRLKTHLKQLFIAALTYEIH